MLKDDKPIVAVGFAESDDDNFEEAFNAQFDDEDEEVDDSELDDEDSVDEDDPEEELEDSDEEVEEKPKEEVLEAFLEADFLGEKKPLTKEEAKMYAQMGLNYPRMVEKLKALEENPLLKFANSLMTEYGYSDPNEFLNAINQQKEKETFDKQVKELVEKGVGKDVAERMVKLETSQAETDASNKEAEINKQYQKQREDSYIELFDFYKQKFGKDLDVNELSSQTLEKIQNGVPPKFAYLEQLADEKFVAVEQKVIKHQEKVKKAPPSLDADPQGKDSDEFTEEYIEQMTEKFGQKWVTKNFDRIEKTGYFK